jgi:hypothetical protein
MHDRQDEFHIAPFKKHWPKYAAASEPVVAPKKDHYLCTSFQYYSD